MLDRQHGKFVFCCDGCGTTIETEEHEFSSAVQKMRAEDWQSVATRKGWEHYCPKCYTTDKEG